MSTSVPKPPAKWLFHDQSDGPSFEHTLWLTAASGRSSDGSSSAAHGHDSLTYSSKFQLFGQQTAKCVRRTIVGRDRTLFVLHQKLNARSCHISGQLTDTSADEKTAVHYEQSDGIRWAEERLYVTCQRV